MATRAACYCRISSDREKTALGVERQKKTTTQVCIDNRWDIVDMYVDNDKTAADPSKPRDEYDRLMRDVKAGKIDVVVVAREDRLHRQPGELEAFVDACKSAG